MVEPPEIVAALERLFVERAESKPSAPRRDFAGKRVVVSAGPCHEPIDPVRYIGNRSSGKMGYAVAEAARDRGAEVVLVSGPTALPSPAGVRVVPVETALEMQREIESTIEGADLLVMAAAVADYRVASRDERKIKREKADELTLRLVRNPDILAGLRDRPVFKIGFAAETDDLLENAKGKLARKGAQMFVANDVTSPGSGFGTETNQVVLLDWLGGVEQLPLLPKRAVADAILDRALALWAEFERGGR
jgi:phosphopantothenoylcysteine decarboxylase/phosphopantothenate--cysteine ligase